MSSGGVRLVLPGRTVDAADESNRFLKVETVLQKSVETATRGAEALTETRDLPEDAVIELEFADGTKQWTSAAALRDDLRETDPVNVSDRGTRVPSLMAAETAVERGVGGIVLRTLKILKVDPVDAAADMATNAVIAHFEQKVLPKQGLFFYPKPTFIGEPAKDLTAAEPLLIFLHGTMSSTTGSFGKLHQTLEWDRLAARYSGRILAFEHATLSKSPVTNAIELAKVLPKGATLHLVSHSRGGGLVGELLSLKPGQKIDNLVEVLPDGQAIRELMAVLNKQQFKIERFVRVACPARGTTLASKRLDLYLSAFMNLIELVPIARDSFAVDFVKAVTLEVAKRRTDPKELPGIEAMMPESPLIRMLNTVAKSDGDLAVIAGDAEAEGILARLKNLAIDAFFLAKNDYVVNTEAMYGGIPRNGQTALRIFDRGPAVDHFHYFVNENTRRKMADCLELGAAGAGFERGLLPAFVTKLVEKLNPNRPSVYLLPGIMGSKISVDDDSIWINPAQLALGGLKRMGVLTTGTADGILNSFYGAFSSRLLPVFNVREFAYDWRNSLEAAAKALAAKVRQDLDDSKQPIHFAAHSMGGLVVRTMIANHPDVWTKVTSRGGRLLMIGTPNAGSYAVAVTLAGQNPLVDMLGKVDFRNTENELRDVIGTFPGLIELLSEDLFSTEAWAGRPGITPPTVALLKAAKAVRAKLRDIVDPRAMVYVAGTGATADGWETKNGKVEFKFNPNGDGTVTHDSGKLPGVRTWYVDAAHGNLVNSLSSFDAYIDLLRGGTTTQLSDTPIRSRSAEPVRRKTVTALFPTPEELEAAALGGVPFAAEAPISKLPALQVSVVHGDLRYSNLAVAVGHYEGDSIVNAEAALSAALGGELNRRFQMGLYPGPEGTTEVILPKDAKPAGALVIGLGAVGEVTFDKVRSGVTAAALRFALECSQRDLIGISFGALLMGTFGGRNSLSIEQSVRAIVMGVLAANRTLLDQKQNPIARLELIELYEDVANQAADALDRMTEALATEDPSIHLTMSPRYLRSIEGGRATRPGEVYSAGWWRRVQITRTENKGVQPLDGEQLLALLKRARTSQNPAAVEQFVGDLLKGNLAPDQSRGAHLQFLALTDRARAEERDQTIQTGLIDGLVKELVGSTSVNSEFGRTLFNLLVPPDFKQEASAQANLMLVLDRGSAQYPWEMLAGTRGGKAEPLALEKGLIRQFKTSRFRLRPRGTTANNMLVIGDPKNDLFQLPGAEREARHVAATFKQYDYAVTELYQPDAVSAISALFSSEYRIVHIAGHGQFDPDDPINSGVLLNNGCKISPAEVRSLDTVPELVFLNCCHIGQVEDEKRRKIDNFHQLAASVSQELIEIGVRAVVAAGWAVNDAAAATFAQTFYERMLAGKHFGEAVQLARKATQRNHPNTNTWGAYQCYGNSDFTINASGWRGPAATPRFYSRSQALDYLQNLLASIKTAEEPTQREKLTGDLRSIEVVMPEHWKDGEMLTVLALNWSALKKSDVAIGLFERAISAEYANAPFRAAEQLANLQARLAEELASADWSKAKNLFDNAFVAIDRLIAQAGTSERWSIQGSAQKLYAITLANQKKPWKEIEPHLRNAAGAYQKAAERAERQDRLETYATLNAAACHLLLTPSKKDKDGLILTMQSFIKRLEKHSPADRQDLWDRFAEPDALVMLHLAQGDLDTKQRAIAQSYTKEIARGIEPGQLDTVLKQFHFLETMLRRKSPGSPLANTIASLEKAIRASTVKTV